ncbi:unnamed protein product [Brassicogethes aeneus]|uniref:Uncharacterized protein n=1 Tax=Brassicogethes aeneus TaxID=1431903 RepID=A0A9P0BGB7_BRAAE|nr:unnamed protein product [Brassicogethes aeneus]
MPSSISEPSPSTSPSPMLLESSPLPPFRCLLEPNEGVVDLFDMNELPSPAKKRRYVFTQDGFYVKNVSNLPGLISTLSEYDWELIDFRLINFEQDWELIDFRLINFEQDLLAVISELQVEYNQNLDDWAHAHCSHFTSERVFVNLQEKENYFSRFMKIIPNFCCIQLEENCYTEEPCRVCGEFFCFCGVELKVNDLIETVDLTGPELKVNDLIETIDLTATQPPELPPLQLLTQPQLPPAETVDLTGPELKVNDLIETIDLTATQPPELPPLQLLTQPQLPPAETVDLTGPELKVNDLIETIDLTATQPPELPPLQLLTQSQLPPAETVDLTGPELKVNDLIETIDLTATQPPELPPLQLLTQPQLPPAETVDLTGPELKVNDLIETIDLTATQPPELPPLQLLTQPQLPPAWVIQNYPPPSQLQELRTLISATGSSPTTTIDPPGAIPNKGNNQQWKGRGVPTTKTPKTINKSPKTLKVSDNKTVQDNSTDLVTVNKTPPSVNKENINPNLLVNCKYNFNPSYEPSPNNSDESFHEVGSFNVSPSTSEILAEINKDINQALKSSSNKEDCFNFSVRRDNEDHGTEQATNYVNIKQNITSKNKTKNTENNKKKTSVKTKRHPSEKSKTILEKKKKTNQIHIIDDIKILSETSIIQPTKDQTNMSAPQQPPLNPPPAPDTSDNMDLENSQAASQFKEETMKKINNLFPKQPENHPITVEVLVHNNPDNTNNQPSQQPITIPKNTLPIQQTNTTDENLFIKPKKTLPINKIKKIIQNPVRTQNKFQDLDKIDVMETDDTQQEPTATNTSAEATRQPPTKQPTPVVRVFTRLFPSITKAITTTNDQQKNHPLLPIVSTLNNKTSNAPGSPSERNGQLCRQQIEGWHVTMQGHNICQGFQRRRDYHRESGPPLYLVKNTPPDKGFHTRVRKDCETPKETQNPQMNPPGDDKKQSVTPGKSSEPGKPEASSPKPLETERHSAAPSARREINFEQYDVETAIYNLVNKIIPDTESTSVGGANVHSTAGSTEFIKPQGSPLRPARFNPSKTDAPSKQKSEQSAAESIEEIHSTPKKKKKLKKSKKHNTNKDKNGSDSNSSQPRKRKEPKNTSKQDQEAEINIKEILEKIKENKTTDSDITMRSTDNQSPTDYSLNEDDLSTHDKEFTPVSPKKYIPITTINKNKNKKTANKEIPLKNKFGPLSEGNDETGQKNIDPIHGTSQTTTTSACNILPPDTSQTATGDKQTTSIQPNNSAQNIKKPPPIKSPTPEDDTNSVECADRNRSRSESPRTKSTPTSPGEDSEDQQRRSESPETRRHPTTTQLTTSDSQKVVPGGPFKSDIDGNYNQPYARVGCLGRGRGIKIKPKCSDENQKLTSESQNIPKTSFKNTKTHSEDPAKSSAPSTSECPKTVEIRDGHYDSPKIVTLRKPKINILSEIRLDQSRNKQCPLNSSESGVNKFYDTKTNKQIKRKTPPNNEKENRPPKKVDICKPEPAPIEEGNYNPDIQIEALSTDRCNTASKAQGDKEDRCSLENRCDEEDRRFSINRNPTGTYKTKIPGIVVKTHKRRHLSEVGKIPKKKKKKTKPKMQDPNNTKITENQPQTVADDHVPPPDHPPASTQVNPQQIASQLNENTLKLVGNLFGGEPVAEAGTKTFTANTFCAPGSSNADNLGNNGPNDFVHPRRTIPFKKISMIRAVKELNNRMKNVTNETDRGEKGGIFPERLTRAIQWLRVRLLTFVEKSGFRAVTVATRGTGQLSSDLESIAEESPNFETFEQSAFRLIYRRLGYVPRYLRGLVRRLWSKTHRMDDYWSHLVDVLKGEPVLKAWVDTDGERKALVKYETEILAQWALVLEYEGFNVIHLLKLLRQQFLNYVADDKAFSVEYQAAGVKKTFSYTNKEKMSTDIKMIIMLFCQRGNDVAKVSGKSKEGIKGLLDMLVTKYNIDSVKHAAGTTLPPDVITIPRIVACFPPFSCELFHHGQARRMFELSDLNITTEGASAALLCPTMGCLYPSKFITLGTTNILHVAFLVAVKVDQIIYSKKHDLTRLDELARYFAAEYRTTITPAQTREKFFKNVDPSTNANIMGQPAVGEYVTIAQENGHYLAVRIMDISENLDYLSSKIDGYRIIPDSFLFNEDFTPTGSFSSVKEQSAKKRLFFECDVCSKNEAECKKPKLDTDSLSSSVKDYVNLKNIFDKLMNKFKDIQKETSSFENALIKIWEKLEMFHQKSSEDMDELPPRMKMKSRLTID